MFSWGELFSTFMARKIMGIKGTCRSANRGGVPFCLLPYIAGLPFHPAFILPASLLPSWQNFRQSGQKRAKVNKFLGVLGVFSGKSETKTAKSKHIFGKGLQDMVAGSRILYALRCAHLWQLVGSCGRLWALLACPLLWSCVPCLFRGFLALLVWDCLKICPYFAF